MCTEQLCKQSALYCEEHYQQTFKRQRRHRIIGKYGKVALDIADAAGDVCQSCGTTRDQKRIDIHHIDGDYGNRDPSNFAVICVDCHWVAHRLILSRDRKGFVRWFEQTYPDKPLR